MIGWKDNPIGNQVARLKARVKVLNIVHAAPSEISILSEKDLKSSQAATITEPKTRVLPLKIYTCVL